MGKKCNSNHFLSLSLSLFLSPPHSQKELIEVDSEVVFELAAYILQVSFIERVAFMHQNLSLVVFRTFQHKAEIFYLTVHVSICTCLQRARRYQQPLKQAQMCLSGHLPHLKQKTSQIFKLRHRRCHCNQSYI